jgi:hypothetical protein
MMLIIRDASAKTTGRVAIVETILIVVTSAEMIACLVKDVVVVRLVQGVVDAAVEGVATRHGLR